MRRWVTIIMLAVSLGMQAQDSLNVSQTQDSLSVSQPKEEKKSWLNRTKDKLIHTLESFTYIDTNYVEPQHYDWSVMLQATYNYDYYRLTSVGENRQSFHFAPTPSLKVGPYFGWRWVFLGYTFDLRHVDMDTKSLKQEIDFSFYSAQIGADFYYRRTGCDYKLRNVRLGSNVSTAAIDGEPFDGLSVGITGLNVYYIFNHERFSYPAAFSQSTCQKISCGSWMVGLGYMRNSLEFDHERLQQLIEERLPGQEIKLDSGLMFNSVKYYDTSIWGGYAYNWVFARNFLFCASASLALAYKKTRGESTGSGSPWKFSDFSISNFNIDGIGRFGLVYNDTRWYAGASAIIRAYNYHKSRFAANNIFGSLNFYVGYNFGLRKEYRKKK